MTRADWRQAKRHGFSDGQLAYLWGGRRRPTVRAARLARGRARHVQDRRHLRGRVRRAHAVPLRHLRGRGRGRAARRRPAVVILGSGPNRIGQGVEFDYCCVHAAFALRDAGYETVMVNCNPETVSTDYDTSDRLFFEPLTDEDVLQRLRRACRTRRRRAGRCAGVIVAPRRPDAAEARAHARSRPGIADPRHEPRRRSTPPRTASSSTRCASGSASRSRPAASRPTPTRRSRSRHGIGYPVLVRPVVRARRARDGDRLRRHRPAPGDGRARAHRLARPRRRPVRGTAGARRPLPRRRGRGRRRRAARPHRRVLIGGIMEHIEEAGVHSGDSACAIPPPTLAGAVLADDRAAHARARRRARRRRVCSTCSTR